MRPFWICLLILCCTHVFGQQGEHIFNDSILHEIRIEINTTDWFEQLQADYEYNRTNAEDEAETYRVCKVVIDGIVKDSCGIREKGNFSYSINKYVKKKSFKIAFDEFKDQKYNGIKKLVLNNGTNDASMLREAYAYKLLRHENIPASRCSFAKVYINDTYWGLYELVENVDKTFLKRFYDGTDNDGNLFKTTQAGGAYLDWKGSDSSLYKTSLDLKTNETADNWNGLVHLIDVINNQPEKTKEVFDVYQYLKVLAIEKVIYSWDSYWANGNNYYLYQHPDGKFRWIPWDYNECMHHFTGPISILVPDDYYIIPTNKFDKRPLLQAIFSDETNKTFYLDEVCHLLNEVLISDSIAAQFSFWHHLIKQAYNDDENKLNTMEAFDKSLTDETNELIDFPRNGIAFHVHFPGIIPFLTSRKEWAADQLKAYHATCELTDTDDDLMYKLTVFPNPAKDVTQVSWEGESINYTQFSFIDALGKTVLQTGWDLTTGNSVTLSISSLHAGLYVVLKRDAQGNYGVGKLVKN